MKRAGRAVAWGLVSAVVLSLLIGGWAGIGAGGLVGLVGAAWLVRTDPGPTAGDAAEVGAELPFALDLMAAGLRAGVPTARVMAVVSHEVGGALGDILDTAARSLAMGTPASRAFDRLERYPDGARLARAAARTADSGASLAVACARIADELRAGRAGAAEASAARAAVWIVLPLGLCFLPAFVLTGVVPVVMSVLGGVLR